MGMLLLLTGSTVNAFSETTSVNFQAREVYKEVIYNGIQMEIPIANCTDFVNKVPIYALDNEKTYKLNPSVGFYTYINIIILFYLFVNMLFQYDKLKYKFIIFIL